jgi:hypothetical protein
MGAFAIFEEDGGYDSLYGRIKDCTGRFTGRRYVADPTST